MKNALILAQANGFKSISIPAISSGIFGFPKDRCAKILVNESIRFIKNSNTKRRGCSLQTVEFCILDEDTLKEFRMEFDSMKDSQMLN